MDLALLGLVVRWPQSSGCGLALAPASRSRVGHAVAPPRRQALRPKSIALIPQSVGPIPLRQEAGLRGADHLEVLSRVPAARLPLWDDHARECLEPSDHRNQCRQRLAFQQQFAARSECLLALPPARSAGRSTKLYQVWKTGGRSRKMVALVCCAAADVLGKDWHMLASESTRLTPGWRMASLAARPCVTASAAAPRKTSREELLELWQLVESEEDEEPFFFFFFFLLPPPSRGKSVRH